LLQADGSKDQGALARLQHSLSTSFVAKGDARDLSRLLERYADWASGLGVREQWPLHFTAALDKVPKVKIKAWLRDQRAAQVRRHGKRPEDETEAPAADAKAEDAAIAQSPHSSAPALDEAVLEKIRANKERALAIRRAKEEADAVARDLAAAETAPAADDADTAPTQHIAVEEPTQLVVGAGDGASDASQPVLLESLLADDEPALHGDEHDD